MKTKLLKRIRSRYEWYWNDSLNQWIVMDHIDRTVMGHKKASNFIVHWVADFLGMGSHHRYCKRLAKRESLLNYRKAKDQAVKCKEHNRLLKSSWLL